MQNFAFTENIKNFKKEKQNISLKHRVQKRIDISDDRALATIQKCQKIGL